MSEKRFRHFQDRQTVLQLIDEIRARHKCPYSAIIDDIVQQLRTFYQESFGASQNPTRFFNTSSSAPVLVRPRFIVALSGGIDSTVVTYLAVRAVGVEHVLPVTMPGHPNDESAYMANLVRQDLGLTEVGAPYVISIEEIVGTHMRLCSAFNDVHIRLGIHHQTQRREQQIRSGNFASRVRIAIIYDLQRAIRGRVLGTMNRTEYYQGYGAKFGTPDAYDYGVLNEFYKLDIREIGKQLGIPPAILDAAPSTGFFAGQTHEEELGATIEEQDIFVYLLFEKGYSAEHIIKEYGASPAFIRVMQERFSASTHKRSLNTQPHVQL